MMMGLPASGKSWAARAIAASSVAGRRGADGQQRDSACRVLRTDEIRKELLGLSASTRIAPGTPEADRAYSPAMTTRTYDELLARAAAALDRGELVIADATFSAPAARAPVLSLARRHGQRGGAWCVVWCRADDDTIRARLAQRATDPTEASDADWSVYQAAKRRFAPPDDRELEPARLVICEPGVTEAELARRVIAALHAGGHSA